MMKITNMTCSIALACALLCANLNNSATAADFRDFNKDGKLSQEEFTTPMVKRFKALDKNNDGFLSSSELNPAPPPAAEISPERKAKMKARRLENQKRLKTQSQN